VLASLALVFLLSGMILVTRQVPLNKPPEVLAERARAALRSAGHAEAPADTAYGFEYDLEYYRHVVEHDQTMMRWDGLETGQPAAMHFWYRQSPRPLEPQAGPEVTSTDPERQLYTGMADARLDTEGRLVELQVVPPEVEEPGAGAAEPDWSPLFAEAGLDINKFTPAEPRWAPPSFADRRAAWEGAFPLRPETPLRVEAAAYRGRAVAFKLVAPWTKPYRMEPYATAPGMKRLLMFVFAVFVTLLLAGAWLARHNFRMGRGDRRGATKLALFVFSAHLVGGLVGASHVPTFLGEVGVLYAAVKPALFFAALLWLFYIALEPYVRRRSPHRLISWTRLLAGDWRDPLVGRDVLIGGLCGVGLTLLYHLQNLTPGWLGWPPDVPAATANGWALNGTKGLLERALVGVDMSLVQALGYFFIFLLLFVVLRRGWAAAGAGWALMTVLYSTGGDYPAVVWGYGMAAAALVTFVLMRFGLLSLATLFLFSYLTYNLPLTMNLSAWYGASTIFVLITAGALAAGGFYLSLGGQQLLSGSILPD
jgi:serine/threonine-protein kinase